MLAEEAAKTASLAARAERSAVRRDRFLDARQRTIGLDLDALDQQVREKEEKRRAEAEEELRERENEERIRRAIARHEAEAAEDRRLRQEAVNQALREQVLSKPFTASAKLNAAGGGSPVRDSDFSSCGVSSLQVFDGEDLMEGDRRLLQAAQMRKWCLEQQREKEERMAAEKQSDREYAAYLESLGVMRDGLEARMKAERAAQAAATKATNDRMVLEKTEKARREAVTDTMASSAELDFAATSGILAERLSDSVSALGPHRIRKDYYRGMSEEEKQKWLEDIAAQKEEQASKALQEKLDDLAVAEEQMDLVRKARRYEVEVEREREQARLRHLAELERQRADKRARDAKEQAERQSRAIGGQFFAGFGRSDR